MRYRVGAKKVKKKTFALGMGIVGAGGVLLLLILLKISEERFGRSRAGDPPLASAHAASEEPLWLIRMPDEAALDSPPSEDEIARFLARRGAYLHIALQDLLKDREWARQVLGQRQIFHELAAFEAHSHIPVKVRFITWADALRYFADYVSDARNPPVVAQLGDTWAAYFRSLGVVAYERRHTWDVRMLWYWRDLVTAEEIADGDGFLRACRKLRENPPPGLEAPFAIPTALDWNLLHDLSIWLYNAGLPALIRTDKKFGLLPWKEAVFAGAEGERAVRFLITLAKGGYVALPEKQSPELLEDFLDRKYAMVILGPAVAERAEKRLGPGWSAQIGATLPPKIGASDATTIIGGSLLVVLDPRRGRDAAGLKRARRLVDFLCSTESQRRYVRALGALSGNPQVRLESPHADVVRAALERGRRYPEIAEWAPIVENLVTRDNIYTFWKRLSALATAQMTAASIEDQMRERLILAALRSAEAEINRELSPGKFDLVRPWLLTVIGLLLAGAAVGAWNQRVRHRRSEELRRARNLLATLERRLEEAQDRRSLTPTMLGVPMLEGKGYPALYLDAVRRQVLIKRSPAEPLEELIRGAEYDLFRHLLECLQMGWYETHWIWGYVLWPTAHPKFPKESFATHCTKLRKRMEEAWLLGRILGRGSRRGGAIPIQVRDVHFYTDALAEGEAHPVWSLFHAWDQAVKAYKAHRWEETRTHLERVLQRDPENWPGNLLLCRLALEGHVEQDEKLVQRAFEFARKQKASYEHALRQIEGLTEEKVSREHKERIRSRWEALSEILSQGPEPELRAPTEWTPWRTREQIILWARYLNGEKSALSDEEAKVIERVRRFVLHHSSRDMAAEVEEYFRSLVQEMALDATRWPTEKFPSSEKAFKYLALDYVRAGIWRLSDDEESQAVTKAQNLRKLWSTRARLHRQLEREPTEEELTAECRRRYGWSRSMVAHLLELERFCRLFPLESAPREEP